MRNKSEYQMTKTCLNNWKIRILKLSFDFAQDGEPFDAAHGRESAERLVEPFRPALARHDWNKLALLQ
jgi:hypothetical protein